jgi:CDP-4-dehydro-6-deoxyglucose reductase
VTLSSNLRLAPDVHRLTFDLPPNDPLRFVPGQYVTFFLERGGRAVPRSYSIYSSAHQEEEFSLLVHRVPGGFASNLLCDLSPESRPNLSILAPLGKFVLRPPGGREVVFVATGVGVAPFAPMLERLGERSPQTSAWLFWGSRYPEDLVDLPAWERLAQRWPAFHLVPVVSRPRPGDGWHGVVGHVEGPLRDRFPELARADLYLCGSNRMVNETHALALDLGCPRDRIFADRWGEALD